ncbi:MAG: putative protein N(5)-glutamine methyltransferase [Janthinobacterium lividum]
MSEPPPELVARLRAAGCVFAEEEASLLVEATADPARRELLVRRRVTGERLEDVLGWAEFCGVRYLISPGVFVPRHRTEHLARLARARLAPDGTLLDLCCGTGALAGAVTRWIPGLVVHAADLDPAAVACARRNLPGVTVHTGDLYDALPPLLAGTVDVLLANVPYVPHDEIAFLPPEARDHENPLAVDGGPDGLSVFRRVVSGAMRWLAPGGWLFCEVSQGQADLAVDIATRAGLEAFTEFSEEFETTALVGRRPH